MDILLFDQGVTFLSYRNGRTYIHTNTHTDRQFDSMTELVGGPIWWKKGSLRLTIPCWGEGEMREEKKREKEREIDWERERVWER